MADLAFENDVEALMMTRRLISFLPGSNRDKPPVVPCDDAADRIDQSLDTLVPEQRQPVVRHEGADLQDRRRRRRFFELQPDYAKNIIIGLARMEGSTVGIVANQPLVLAGCLDIKSSIKARDSCASATPSTSRW